MDGQTAVPYSDFIFEDNYIPAALSVCFSLIAMLISILTLILIRKTKPRLHTVNHLLMCNTCVATIFYCIIIINNYIFLIFIQWDTSDMSCRWRGYFTYNGIAQVMYSFLIQAVSRFFFSELSAKYRWLTTFKTHYILIAIQWFVGFSITLPAVITKDIHFSLRFLCWVPGGNILHQIYTAFAYYLVPVVCIATIYIYIYCRIRRKKTAATTGNFINSQKRDMEVLRNISILISIYLLGGLPSLASIWYPNKIVYLTSLVSQAFVLIIAALSNVLLDRGVRQTVKSIIRRPVPVVPFNTNVQQKEFSKLRKV